MAWLSLASSVVAFAALVILIVLLPGGGQWALGLSFVSAIIGVVTGFFARRQASAGPAKAGLTLGAIALVLNVLFVLYLTPIEVQSDGPVQEDGGGVELGMEETNRAYQANG